MPCYIHTYRQTDANTLNMRAEPAAHIEIHGRLERGGARASSERAREPGAAGGPADRAPWVLRAPRTCAGAGWVATCAHRDVGQRAGESSQPGVLTARSVCRRTAA